jgi:hypothetical protein
MLRDRARIGRSLLGVFVLFTSAGSLREMVGGELKLAGPEIQPRTSVRTACRDRSAIAGGWYIEVDGWCVGFDGVVAAPPVPEVEPGQGDAVPLPPRVPSAGARRYEESILRHAAREGIDPRLVAAIIAEESGFRADAVSPRGAVGLMQVRAIAARAVDEVAFHSPEDNVRVGVRYLKHLLAQLAAAEGRDRIALALAAYNVGPGHLRDAQSLARRAGLNPWRWHGGVERVMPLLEDPAIHAELPGGYARGRGTVAYVTRVLERWDGLRG